jgi:hypothetical protein
MPLCRDPLVAHLNSLGFNALRIPRTDYVPTTLVFVERGNPPSLLGSFQEGFEQVSPLESTIAAAGQFSGTTTGSYRNKIGLKLACDWLKADPTSLSGALAGARKLTFRFGEMRLMSVSMAALINAIATSEPSPLLCSLAGSRLYVISEVLQAKQFMLLTEGEASKVAAIAVSAISPDRIRADMSIDASKANSGMLVFKAAVHHTIGFKAYEIEIAGGEMRLVPNSGSLGLSHLADVEESYSPTLFDDTVL